MTAEAGRNLSAEYLYTPDESPVQYGSLSQIRAYLRKQLKIDPKAFRAASKDLANFAKRNTLGTHTEPRKSKKRTGIFHYGIFPHKDEFFESDLMDVFGYRGQEDAQLKKLNDGYVYLLLVINGGTKYLYAKKLRTKSGSEVAARLRDIFYEIGIMRRGTAAESGFHAVLTHSDRGKEYYNDDVAGMLEHLGVRLYSSHSDHKAAMIERVIGTIRGKLVKAIEQKGEKWIDLYARVVKLYNSQYHRTIGMSPEQAEANFDLALFNTVENHEKSDAATRCRVPRQSNVLKPAKFAKGDVVRIKVAGHEFRKGSAKTWTDEVYRVSGVKRTKSKYVYSVESMSGETILGKFDADMLKAAVEEKADARHKLRVVGER